MRIYLDMCSIQRPMDDHARSAYGWRRRPFSGFWCCVMRAKPNSSILMRCGSRRHAIRIQSDGATRSVSAGTDRGDRRMSVPAMPLDEVTQRAIHILSREMGVADTMRFLKQ